MGMWQKWVDSGSNYETLQWCENVTTNEEAREFFSTYACDVDLQLALFDSGVRLNGMVYQLWHICQGSWREVSIELFGSLQGYYSRISWCLEFL